jgi:hypothetical protein
MNILAIDRGFDAFIANVFQRGVDKAADKDALIALAQPPTRGMGDRGGT